MFAVACWQMPVTKNPWEPMETPWGTMGIHAKPGFPENPSGKRPRTRPGRLPDASRTIEFEDTDASRARRLPFLPQYEREAAAEAPPRRRAARHHCGAHMRYMWSRRRRRGPLRVERGLTGTGRSVFTAGRACSTAPLWNGRVPIFPKECRTVLGPP
eukprot:gene14317-biopygen15656